GADECSPFIRSMSVSNYRGVVAFYISELTEDGWSIQCDSSDPEPGSMRFEKHFPSGGVIEFGGFVFGLYNQATSNWVTAKKGEDYAINLTLKSDSLGVWASELRLLS